MIIIRSPLLNTSSVGEQIAWEEFLELLANFGNLPRKYRLLPDLIGVARGIAKGGGGGGLSL